MCEWAKLYTWWPHIDDDIEQLVAICNTCQHEQAKEPEVTLFSWSVPSKPWSKVHFDFVGPFETFMLLIATDTYMK